VMVETQGHSEIGRYRDGSWHPNDCN
jgi:hypothetical protein